ncbi:MAG TPA: hypothetical protein VG711_12365, partial [Phycisphaerales bacterium]|nr:hypothetical protein [Phycisphaerales bacterium]
LTAAQASAYASLHHSFALAYTAANDPQSNSSVNITAKNTAKVALKAEARTLARIVRAFPGVTSDPRVTLGLTVTDGQATAINPPDAPPHVSVSSVRGLSIRLQLRDAQALTRKGRPAGVAAAAIFCCVQPQDSKDEPPIVLSEWTFAGTTSRTEHELNFGAEVQPGSQVWITAYWLNAKQQHGPASSPIMTHTQFGGVVSKSHSLKLAA